MQAQQLVTALADKLVSFVPPIYVDTAQNVGDKIVQYVLDGRPVGPTSKWFLADAPSAFAIAIGYIGFVFVGSAIMHFSGIKPLDRFTYPFRFGYNLVQMMLCSYMFMEAAMLGYRNNYTMTPCNRYDVANPPLANLLWLFYISKVLDFMDTVFIITGKKWNQLSFLHVYHHTTIFLFYWLNLNAGYDGDVYLTIVLNGFIHALMYTYYFVALHTKDIWWKKHVTKFQLIQFFGMSSQAVYLMATGCQTYPIRIVQAYFLYIVSLIFLFGNFYVKSYLTKPKKGKKSGEKPAAAAVADKKKA